MKRLLGLCTVLLCVLANLLLQAEDFSGKVVGVIDGDTLNVLHDGKAEKIRLNGIDCPESGQAFGTKAKQFASDAAFGKTVLIKVTDKDRYGRTVGDVILPDGKNLNQELVREGFAWWYREYAQGNKTLELLESDAKANKRGLWADPQPVAPWDFRHGRSSAGSSPGDSSSILVVTSDGKKIQADSVRYSGGQFEVESKGAKVSLATGAVVSLSAIVSQEQARQTEEGLRKENADLRGQLEAARTEIAGLREDLDKAKTSVDYHKASQGVAEKELDKIQAEEDAKAEAAKPKTQMRTAKPVYSAPSADSGQTVYITRTGRKYHNAGCRSLSRSSIPISLSDAKARGYGPCSICKPPR